MINLRKGIMTFVVVFAVIVSFLTPVPATDLGGLSLGKKPAKALSVPISSAPRFFRGVGGVAFSVIAEPAANTEFVSIAYDAERPDGQRLELRLSIDGKPSQATAEIYDWELIPLVRFVEASGESCVTLFGELESEEETAKHLARSDRIINYHGALEDTLLGLRLFQADILIILDEACDLPRTEAGGPYILGAGEVEPNVENNRKRLEQFEERAASALDYQSYVIWDKGQQVRFTAMDGKLRYPGDPKPYWYLWRDETSPKLENLIFSAQLIALSIDFEESPAKKRELEAKLEKKIAEIETVRSELGIEELKKQNEVVNSALQEAGMINPAIARSLTVTMRYAALLRYVKRERPKAFAALRESLADVRLQPHVETPTILPVPGG